MWSSVAITSTAAVPSPAFGSTGWRRATQVTGNLLHDNSSQDIFFEMQHGPILVANNLFLSKRHAFDLNSQGIAFAHNLILGTIGNDRGDTRATPFHQAHATELAGLHADSSQTDSGDHRFYNNLFVAPCSLQVMDNSALPCFGAGNVFTKGSQSSKFDVDALRKPDFNPGVNAGAKSRRLVSHARRGQVVAQRSGAQTGDDGLARQGEGFRLRLRKRRRLAAPRRHRLLRQPAERKESVPRPV